MTLPSVDLPAYTDLSGLSSLKRGAMNHDPATIRKVAQQFESLFTRMMLKSMRDAVGTDPLFGSDQQKMYQEMADDQLSVQMSKGKGLGLADMLIRQLQKLGVPGASTALQAAPGRESSGTVKGTGTATGTGTPTGTGIATGTGTSAGSGTPARSGPLSALAAYSATQRAASGATSEAVKTGFVNAMWPHAQQAGHELGVDPSTLIAQAALETNWGRNLPQDAAGASSHNLFGIKASPDWTGSSVLAGTQEVQSGLSTLTTAQFRSYSSPAQSFQDYVTLLRSNPRYSTALNTGSDARAFATALQRGGYATDPDYAHKVGAMAQQVAATLQTVIFPAAASAADLKLGVAVPITARTGTL